MTISETITHELKTMLNDVEVAAEEELPNEKPMMKNAFKYKYMMHKVRGIIRKYGDAK